jgi:hypothetical protein
MSITPKDIRGEMSVFTERPFSVLSGLAAQPCDLTEMQSRRQVIRLRRTFSDQDLTQLGKSAGLN